MPFKKKSIQSRNLTQKEYDDLIPPLSKVRVKALKMSKDKKYSLEARRALASLEKKIWNTTNSFPYLSVVD